MTPMAQQNLEEFVLILYTTQQRLL